MNDRCVMCNMPEEKFSVILNEKKICNYCEDFSKVKNDILNYKKKHFLFIDRLNKFRGRYKYDAIVGLSGGKDSTYVVYQLVKKYNLNILAVTYENGFLTEYAKKSVQNTVKELGVDHLLYTPNQKIHKKLYSAALKKMGDPCIACAFAGYFLAIKLCTEMKIPFFIHGRSPFQMYRNYYKENNDIFLLMMDLNVMKHDFARLAPVYKTVNNKIRMLINQITENKEDAEEIMGEFLIEDEYLNDQFTPEFLSYFLFHEYNEVEIKKEIYNEIGWEYADNEGLMGHHDCAIHYAAGYMYQKLNGLDALEPDLAVMARFNTISKADFKSIIKENTPSSYELHESKKNLCAFCDLNSIEILDEYIAKLKEQGINKFESR